MTMGVLCRLRVAAEEIRVGYTRRYGQGYPEAHVLADAMPDLLRVVEAVAKKKPTQPDGAMGLFCPMYCGAHTEDEPVQSYSAGFADSINPTDAEMDLYDARAKAWEAQAVAAMEHAPDCAWVLARTLTSRP